MHSLPVIGRWRFLLILVVMLGLPVYFLISTDEIRGSPVVLFFPSFTVIFSSVRLAFVVRATQSQRLLLMTFYVFVYVFLGLAALLQSASQTYPWPERFSEETVAYASAMIWIGLLTFEFGYAQTPKSLARAIGWFTSRELSRPRAILVGAVALMVTPLLFAYYGGVTQIFQARVDKLNTAIDAIGGEGQVLTQTINAVERVPLFICFIVLLASTRPAGKYFSSAKTFAVTFGAFLLLLGLANFLASNPVSSERYWTGTVYISCLLVFWQRKGEISLFRWALALVLGLIFVFPFSDLFRVSISPDLDAVFSIPVAEQLGQKGDYDSFQQVGNSIIYVEEYGLRLGQQALASIFFWFPRAYWASKSAGSGGLVADGLGYSFNNLSMPLWGEFYLDAGVMGVAIGFYLYGALLGSLDRSSRTASAFTVGTVLVPIYAIYQFITLRGSLIAATSLFAPVIIMLFVCSRRKSRPFDVL